MTYPSFRISSASDPSEHTDVTLHPLASIASIKGSKNRFRVKSTAQSSQIFIESMVSVVSDKAYFELKQNAKGDIHE
jgi:hypothetical protein